MSDQRSPLVIVGIVVAVVGVLVALAIVLLVIFGSVVTVSTETESGTAVTVNTDVEPSVPASTAVEP